MVAIANELRAVKPCCRATVWGLWENPLGVYHLYALAVGPQNVAVLTNGISRHQWVCSGGGSSAEVVDVESGPYTALTGVSPFASVCDHGGRRGLLLPAKEPMGTSS